MAQRTLVIVNPRSRNGATGRRFPGVERQLRARLGPLEVLPPPGRHFFGTSNVTIGSSLNGMIHPREPSALPVAHLTL